MPEVAVTRITGARTIDVRARTSLTLAGSDAVHQDPDYSGAYVVLATDGPHEGVGMTFTIGRGNDLCCAAIEQLAPLVVGLDLAEIVGDGAAFWRRLTNDGQLRWLGPEKGVIHLATAALVNAVWDLWAKVEGKPLWRLVADLTPEQLVGCIDFRYLSDALDRDEALDLLRALEPTKAERVAELERDGYPAYLTSAGWLGYPEDTVRDLCREALAAGWTSFKTKVGIDVASDVRRCEVMREEIGDLPLMADANQVWDVDEAIGWIGHLAPFDLRWIEEPTSPDDVLGHAAIRRAVAPVGVATGEHAANRVIFKQLLQAGAIDYCQIDACRLGGVNEVLAVLLLAAKFGVPVCPHAGGLGLCEYVQHLSVIDYVCVSGSLDDRTTEFADHLHEHFVDPAVIRGGRYVVPRQPGYSADLLPESYDALAFPGGSAWR
jgi:L-fuconate dehydratase